MRSVARFQRLRWIDTQYWYVADGKNNESARWIRIHKKLKADNFQRWISVNYDWQKSLNFSIFQFSKQVKKNNQFLETKLTNWTVCILFLWPPFIQNWEYIPKKQTNDESKISIEIDRNESKQFCFHFTGSGYCFYWQYHL